MQFDRLARNWENLARQDPMWAILTDDGRKGGAWNADEFFASGRETIAWLASWLGLHGFEVNPGSALDFGCGLGRLTQALAPHFERVVGVDVSASMVEGARAHNRHGAKVRYVHNPRPDLAVIASASMDFVLSAIVLQHMRTEYQKVYVREFVRILRPGGLLFFQAPLGLVPGTTFENASAPESDGEARIEMHSLPRSDVDAVVASAGGRVLRDEPDGWAGGNWLSAHYLVRKDG